MEAGKSGEGETLSFKNVFPFPKVSIAFFAYPLVQKCLQNGGFFRVAGGAEAGIGKALAELHGGLVERDVAVAELNRWYEEQQAE